MVSFILLFTLAVCFFCSALLSFFHSVCAIFFRFSISCLTLFELLLLFADILKGNCMTARIYWLMQKTHPYVMMSWHVIMLTLVCLIWHISLLYNCLSATEKRASFRLRHISALVYALCLEVLGVFAWSPSTMVVSACLHFWSKQPTQVDKVHPKTQSKYFFESPLFINSFVSFAQIPRINFLFCLICH